MKYLLTALICLFLLVCVPNATAENGRTWPVQEQVRTWSAGDLIAVGVICKDEDTILEIVNADVLDEQLVLMVMNNLIVTNMCISFPRPMMFLVQKALVQYTDHKGIKSLVLAVGNGDNDFLGWALANGRFVEKTRGMRI